MVAEGDIIVDYGLNGDGNNDEASITINHHLSPRVGRSAQHLNPCLYINVWSMLNDKDIN